MNDIQPIIDDQTLIVLPQLAIAIGLNEAIFLQQLHFLLSCDDKGKEIDGQKWVYNTIAKWQEHNFPFWDEGVIKRTIKNLETDGLIITTAKHNKLNIDRTKWFTIDYDLLYSITEPVDRIKNKRSTRKGAANQRVSFTTRKEQNVLMGEEQNVLLVRTKCSNAKEQNVPTITKDNNTKITTKEVKDNNEVEINFDLPRYDHSSVENKWVFVNQGSDDKPLLVKAFASKVTPKKLWCIVEGENGPPKLCDPSKVFYQNGGPGLNGLKVGEPKSDGPKLSAAELAMKNRLIDLMGFDSTFAVPNHQIKTEMQLIQESAIKSVKNGYKPEFIDDWEKWYQANDWRGKRGDKPTLKILRETWKQFEKSNVKAAAPKVLGEF